MKNIPLSTLSPDDVLNFFGTSDSEIKVLAFNDSALSARDFIYYISREVRGRSYSPTGLQERIFYDVLYSKDDAFYKYFFNFSKVSKTLSIRSKYIFKHVFEDSSNVSLNFVITKVLKFPFKCQNVYLEKNETRLIFNIAHNLSASFDDRLKRIVKKLIKIKELE